MNKQIALLTDDALDAVFGGRATNGSNFPDAHNTAAGALPYTGDVGTGVNTIGPFAVFGTGAAALIIYNFAAAAAAL